MRNSLESKYISFCFIPIAFLFVLVYSSSTSPLYVWEGWDSDIFKEIGLAITQGKLLYVDIFDHKGPNIFMLNALGQLIWPGRTGVFILQCLSLFITLVFLYKTARLFVNGGKSMIALVFSLVVLTGLYRGGNLCEEYVMATNAIALFYATKSICNLVGGGRIPYWYSIIYGFCFTWSFYFRPNDAVAFAGGIMVGTFAYLACTKQIKSALQSALCFVLTFIVLSIPFVVYFASKNALADYYYGLIKFNSIYTDGIVPMLKACLGKKKLLFFFLFLTINVLAYTSGNKRMLYILAPVSLFAWVLTGQNMYEHYAISYLPLIMLFIVFLFGQKQISMVLLSLVIFYCSSVGGIDYIWGIRTCTAERIARIKDNDKDNRIFYNECEKLVDRIPEQERNQVWNFNLFGGEYPLRSIFFHNGLVQCNKVLIFSHYLLDPDLKKQDDIRLHRPKWLMLSHVFDDRFDSREDYAYIESNYELVAQTNPEICNIELYRIK